ncbi:MAG TPA: hypothetical protein DCS09_11175 [Porphyromonadaceae bacterium]|nr:hypothetical protein [Porphyromonadaceae bacterium]HBB00069.1 hypothetical protein [Porphyromonadaceae bacterium]HCC17002.1 hypothetical protein [Porphyromonadaceae bacterium]
MLSHHLHTNIQIKTDKSSPLI